MKISKRMLRKIFLTFGIALLIIHVLCSLSQAATNRCGTEVHSYDYCGEVNVPFSCCDNCGNGFIRDDCGGTCQCDYADDGCDGNCTWWAWEMACCNWGVALDPRKGSAWEDPNTGKVGMPDRWDDGARADGYLVNSIPAKFTIAVSENHDHVAWVIEVRDKGQKIFVSEMNCFCDKCKCSNPKDPSKSVREDEYPVDWGWNQFIYPPLICAKGHFVSPQGTDYGNDPVFLLQNGKYYHIISSDLLDMMEHPNLPRWKWSRVKDIPADRLWGIFITQIYIESGEFITTNSSSNGLLIRQVDTDPVYRVQDGRLQNVSYKECQQNYCWPDIIDVTEDIINFFQEQTLVPFFSQNDVRWAEDQLGDCPSWHIGWIADISDYPANLAGGCATTSKAMVFNYYQPGYTDPRSLNICLTQNSGYAGGCLAPWDDRNNICAPSRVSFAGHVKEESLFATIINSELLAGRPVIAQVKTKKIRSHFVVIIGIKGATYYINDPWDLEFVPRTLDSGALGSYEIQALWLYHGTVESPWPMFQHDAQHTGMSQYLGPQNNQVKWISTLSGYMSYSYNQPVIGLDGTIYTAVFSPGGYMAKLHAISPNGSLKWKSDDMTVSGYCCWFSTISPTIGPDGTIYIGGLLDYTHLILMVVLNGNLFLNLDMTQVSA